MSSQCSFLTKMTSYQRPSFVIHWLIYTHCLHMLLVCKNILKNHIENPALPPFWTNISNPPSGFFFLSLFFKFLLRMKMIILTMIYLEINFPAELMLKINNLFRTNLLRSLFSIFKTTCWVSLLVDQGVPEGRCIQFLRSTSVDSKRFESIKTFRVKIDWKCTCRFITSSLLALPWFGTFGASRFNCRLLSLAKDQWWGFSTRNAHMHVHFVNWIRYKMVYKSK